MRIRTARLAAPAFAGLLATVTACGDSSSASDTSGEQLKIVATTTQVADFARNIGGDRVQVTQILKPNVDPHDYEPSPADVQAIAQADVVVESGVHLEKWLDQTISSSGFHGTLVDSSKGVAVRQGNGTDEEAAGDPHIWHNPKNAEIMSRNIAAALDAKDATDKSTFDANLTAYTGKLDQLDTWITQRIDTLPAAQRKLVTNHDAFGYYVDRYHLTFVGSIIPSFDTSAELSGKQLSTLVAKIKETGVKAIFSESSLPPKTAEAIGKEAGVKVEAGENSLYGDTLGPAGSAGATYLDMERHNTTTIVDALKD
ncbi:metal ABC transporter substrate-binding protein [Actinoallomurus bryophytorum]|uniref:Zinc/manganese transport system substrate-binding protein/manganese/iron transport system substrate-binding protein n=1 Tax=Actinoallomurus bryophytorum TaxID=1490222 RepID=A0A543CI13_9ACTN|nr:metal ABC transporter substrate-binding protein [Actinoallomurus bryophytorum]TQL96731.1 zinc/manganese transport system substrate-binding protein/manganese/iron transport system substrate-binding protein [Actinoallomurus bryophytorum]